MEYISREAALKSICEYCPEIGKCEDTNIRCTEYAAIKAIPTADVAPVRRGKWITLFIMQEGWEWNKCSECGCTWSNETIEAFHIVYCPNCGAKMQ